jgi:raffinose/stachyose/melibiose transport system permease protein
MRNSYKSTFFKKIFIKKQVNSILYALPTVAIFAFIIVVPMIQSIVYSLTDWSGTSSVIRFIGFANYKRMFADKVFLIAAKNTILLALFATLFENVNGVILAVMLNRKRLRGRNFFRALLFVPSLLSVMVIGYMWRYILNPYSGILGMILKLFNVADVAEFNVFSSYTTSFMVIIGTMVWQFSGYDMVIYLSGLQSIPEELYESSSIDGASPVQNFFKITLPLLMPSITVSVFLNLIGSLKSFEHVYVITGGGPAHTTETLSTYIYNTAFSGGQVAYGTAASTVLFFAIMTIAIIQVKYFRSKEVDL